MVKSAAIEAGVLSLVLTPESKADHLQFAAGQYVAISFKRTGRPTPVRCFSIVSSPHDEKLAFAIRVRGRFTQAATELRAGDTVAVEGPFGDFTLNEAYDKRVVMLAAGIGITPFISMLRYASEEQLPIPITLLFANRSAKAIPFMDELLALMQSNPLLQVSFFVTGREELPISGDNYLIPGAIGQQHIGQLVGEKIEGSTYFICGPQGFMKTMQKFLRRQGVDERRIVTESFMQATRSLGAGNKFGIQPLTYGLAAASLLLMAGLIMTLDLSRGAVTSHAAATVQAAATPAVGSANAASASTGMSTTQTYQSPVSSVS